MRKRMATHEKKDDYLTEKMTTYEKKNGNHTRTSTEWLRELKDPPT